MGELTEKQTEEVIDTEENIAVDGQEEAQEVAFVLDEETDTSASQQVPLAAHIKLKEKLRGTKQQAQKVPDLEAQLAARDQEIALLKLSTKPQEQEITFPSRKDFTDDFGDTDDAAYESALAKYQQALHQKAIDATKKSEENFNSRFEELQTGKIQKQRESLLDAALEKSVKEADDLGVKNFDSIAASVSEAMPDGAFQSLLSDGVIDAKTTVYLHKNPQKLEEIIHTARTRGDIAAVTQIVDIKHRLKPSEHQSPPDPDSPVTGAKGGSSNSYQKQLDSLRKGNSYSAQKAIAIKRQAREAGVTVK